MNLILLFPEDFVEDRRRVLLTGRRCEHVRLIHRAGPGDDLLVGLLDGPLGHARVVAADALQVELDVQLDGPAPPPPLPVTLLLALPRPPVLRRALIAATSMGVKQIVLMGAGAVEKSFWQSSAVGQEAITQQLVLGLEQARDTVLPRVLLRRRFRPFVEDELPGMAGDARRLVAHPSCSADCPRGVDGPLLLAVGPESGWNDFELERLEAGGFARVSLGPRSLRVESAIPALLSRLV